MSAVQLRERHIIALVDDEPGVLTSLWRCLRHEPYDVAVTDRPDEALEWVGRCDVSLVVADQRMPGMGGLELLKAVRRRSPTTRCVLLTGFPDEALVAACAEAGVERMLVKPWDEAHLRHTIRQLLHQVEREREEWIEYQ